MHAQGHQATMEGHKAAIEKTTAPAKIKEKAVKNVADKVDTNTQALLEAVKELKLPRKVVRDKNNRLIGVE